jgi:hypothetical protein
MHILRHCDQPPGLLVQETHELLLAQLFVACSHLAMTSQVKAGECHHSSGLVCCCAMGGLHETVAGVISWLAVGCCGCWVSKHTPRCIRLHLS